MRFTTLIHLVLLLSLCFALPALGETRTGPAAAAAEDAPVVIPHSRQFDLRTSDGRVYRILVAEPAGKAPAAGYATLYVLDANAMFVTAVEATRFQHGLIPTLVIGIAYPTGAKLDYQRRFYDYTPVTPAEYILRSTTEPEVRAAGTGGQEKFFDFIQNTLKPEIARRYPVDPSNQSIFGHSLAGRFVLHLLFTHPDSFNNYLAASPSIWWDNASVLNEAAEFIKIAKSQKSNKKLMITVGEMEQKTTPATPAARAAFFAKARMVDNARALADRLAPLSAKGLRTLFVEYAGENHGSVVPFAISRSVRFALALPSP